MSDPKAVGSRPGARLSGLGGARPEDKNTPTNRPDPEARATRVDPSPIPSINKTDPSGLSSSAMSGSVNLKDAVVVAPVKRESKQDATDVPGLSGLQEDDGDFDDTAGGFPRSNAFKTPTDRKAIDGHYIPPRNYEVDKRFPVFINKVAAGLCMDKGPLTAGQMTKLTNTLNALTVEELSLPDGAGKKDTTIGVMPGMGPEGTPLSRKLDLWAIRSEFKIRMAELAGESIKFLAELRKFEENPSRERADRIIRDFMYAETPDKITADHINYDRSLTMKLKEKVEDLASPVNREFFSAVKASIGQLKIGSELDQRNALIGNLTQGIDKAQEKAVKKAEHDAAVLKAATDSLDASGITKL